MYRWTLTKCIFGWLALLLLVACSRTNTNAPSNIDVAVSANAVTITWQDNSDAETGFAVERKGNNDPDFTELTVLPPNTVEYKDTTVVPGESYVYRVRAVGLPTGDAPSPESEAVTPEPVGAVTLELLFADNSTGSGVVTSSPAGITCTLQTGSVCRASFPVGTVITLSATPAAQSSFASWEGCEGTTSTCQVTLTESKTVRVRFVPVQNTLVVEKAGDGAGRVLSDAPPDIDCGEACVASYEVQTIFRLRAVAEAGSSFVGWSENCKPVGTRCEVVIGNGVGTTVTATFSRVAPPAIGAFAVDRPSVLVGSSVVFSWSVTGEQITSLVLRDDKPATADIAVTGLTSYTLPNLQETTTYRLIATNAFGGSTTSQPVTVTVGSVPVLTNLVAAPNPDGSYTLSWAATGSAPISYTLTDLVTNEIASPPGSPFKVIPSGLPTTYQLGASNSFGAAAPLRVTLEPVSGARIQSFTASSRLLFFPGPVTLSWSVTGTEPFTTLTLTRDDTNEVIPLTALSGSLELSISETTRFTLTAKNAFGDDEDRLRVRVGFNDDDDGD
jgi:hypothetical protein